MNKIAKEKIPNFLLFFLFFFWFSSSFSSCLSIVKVLFLITISDITMAFSSHLALRLSVLFRKTTILFLFFFSNVFARVKWRLFLSMWDKQKEKIRETFLSIRKQNVNRLWTLFKSSSFWTEDRSKQNIVMLHVLFCLNQCAIQYIFRLFYIYPLEYFWCCRNENILYNTHRKPYIWIEYLWMSLVTFYVRARVSMCMCLRYTGEIESILCLVRVFPSVVLSFLNSYLFQLNSSRSENSTKQFGRRNVLIYIAITARFTKNRQWNSEAFVAP